MLYAAFLFVAGEAWQPEDAGTWLPLWLRATGGFVLFNALSSGGYFLNDAADAEADRGHPRKQHRPIAAGVIEARRARRVGFALLAGGTLAGLALGWPFALAAAAYAATTVAYTVVLKRFLVIDALAVGILFALRAVAGAFAVDVPPSVWLIVCTFTAAAFVGYVKRGQEVRLLGAQAAAHRGTLAMPARLLDRLVLASGLVTVGLYTAYALTAPNLPPLKMLVTVPFVAYGLHRYHALARETPERDADELVLRDPVLIATVSWFLIVAVALLTFG